MSMPEDAHKMMTNNEYNIRQNGQTRFYVSLRKRIGKYAIGNRIDDMIKLSDNNWETKTKKDEIRIYLKKLLLK